MVKPQEDEEKFKNNNGKKPGKGGKRRKYTNKKKFRPAKPGSSDEGTSDGSVKPGDSVKQDPEWHILNPELKRLVAALPYGEPVGAPFDRGLPKGVTYKNSAMTKGNVPGITTLLLRPSVGYSTNVNSPVNMASWALYSSMRRILSGTFHFDPNDCSIYCIGAANVYSAITELQRVYGIAYSWKQENRYVARYIIQALGFDPDDVLLDLANLEYGINVLIGKARAFYTPRFMTLYAYHAWLYRDVYSEGSDIKDQMYAYVPDGFFVFGFDTQGAGCLKFTQIPNRKRTVKQALAFVNDMINQLMLDEDAVTISSLLKKAYGEENAVQLEMITPAYTTAVVAHNDYILHQFKNATVYPASFNWAPGAGDIVQDKTKQYLTYTTRVAWDGSTPASYSGELPGYAMMLHKIDNIMVQEATLPNEDMAIESTRNMSQIVNTMFAIGGADEDYHITRAEGDAITGSTICTGAYIWWLDGTWNIHEFPYHKYIVLPNQAVIGSGTLDFSQLNVPSIPMLIGLSKSFKYLPEINIVFADVDHDAADPTISISDIINLTDYDNFTTIDRNELLNIHEVSIMTEMGVLGNGTIN